MEQCASCEERQTSEQRKGNCSDTLSLSSQELLEQATSISGLQPEEGGQMLCIMNGAMAGLSGGALGYVFGFGKLNTTDGAENGKAPAMVIAY